MRYIVGKKIGMVQVFDVNGKLLPASIIYCEPNSIIKSSTSKTIIGYHELKEKKVNKPLLGFFKKNNSKPYKLICELSNDKTEYKNGDKIDVSIFKKGEYVDVQGLTKGRGFTGAIVRWNFKVGPKSHGAGYPHRYQGSVAFGRGGSQGQRVPKGKKMSGHYGNELVTIQNLVVLDVIVKYNSLLILGSIPGPKNSIVCIKNSNKCIDVKKEYKIISKEIKEEILKSNENLEDKDALHDANIKAEKEANKENKQQKNDSAKME